MEEKSKKQYYQQAEKGLIKAMDGIDEVVRAIVELPESEYQNGAVGSLYENKRNIKRILNTDFDRLAVKSKMEYFSNINFYDNI